MKRLAIITSHPIQYNAPLFRLLAMQEKLQVKVFYTWEQTRDPAKYDPDFGKEISWDVPLLQGYEHSFVKNTASKPGTHHFRGLVNPTLNKEVEEWRPDAILIFGWSFYSHLSAIRHFEGKIPLLFRGDSTLLDEQRGLRQMVRRTLLKWIYRKIDYAFYTGVYNKEYFLKHGLTEAQLIEAPHAIDNDRFKGEGAGYDDQAKAWKAELGISEEDLVVLFSGKLEHKKDPHFLIDLARHLPDPRIKFVFNGSGALEEELKLAAESDPRISFLGFTNQKKMPVVYRLADVFILPSTGPGETWGLAANEAMASGCVVFMSRKAGGSADLVENNRNGITFAPGDVGRCSAMILLLLTNRQMLQKMRQASQEMIGSFSYDRIITAIERLLIK